MALFGSQDATSNAVISAAAQVNLPPNSANRDALFGNVTPDAFVNGLTIGMFGADAAELAVTGGAVIQTIITDPGCGYFANAAATFSGGGTGATANAQSNTLGRISTVHINTAGTSYETNPTVAIAAPGAQAFNALSAVSNTDDFITISTNRYQNNDLVTYLVATGNTAVIGLTNAASYYVVSANSTGVKLSLTYGGAAINLTSTVSETGHTLTGQTATAVAIVGGAQNKGIAHTGWILRTVGSGGRAGRVHNEVLVAGGISAGDGEDAVLPDA